MPPRLKRRRLLEEKNLTAAIFETINAQLAEKGLLMRQGAIVDATIIAAPSSTKNKTGERAPERRQNKKGNPWRFGMKAHVGTDADSGLVHTLVGTAANVNDVTQAPPCCMGKHRRSLAMPATRGRTSAKRTGTNRSSGTLPCGRAYAGRCLTRLGA